MRALVRKSLLFLLLALCISVVYGQKSSLEQSAYDSWRRIQTKNVSNDGRFVLFSYGSALGSNLVIVSTDGSWRKEVSGSNGGLFTEDSRKAIFAISRDSIGIVVLGTDSVNYITGVSSFKVSVGRDNTWIGYKTASQRNVLNLLNIKDLTVTRYGPVVNYIFSEDSQFLILQSELADGSKMIYTLDWVGLNSSQRHSFFSDTSRPISYCFDNQCEQLAIITESAEKRRKLWYYKFGEATARLLLDTLKEHGKTHLITNSGSDFFHFSTNGKYLFFKVKPLRYDSSPELPMGGDVIVWSYLDGKLKSQQLHELKNPNTDPRNKSFLAVFKMDNLLASVIEMENDMVLNGGTPSETDEVLLVHNYGGSAFEFNWNKKSLLSLYLVSIRNGSRRLISKQIVPMDLTNIHISPGGKYVIFYDFTARCYMTYNTITGDLRNISNSIPFPIVDEESSFPGLQRAIGVAAWVEGDKAVFLYDKYDIWKVDPEGLKKPLNMTKGYGRRNLICLRFLRVGGQDYRNPLIVKERDRLLFVAFNYSTKYNGFFEGSMNDNSDPKQLTMGPYIYYYPFSSYNISSMPPIKAKNAEVFVLEKGDSKTSPNVFVTTDLRKFTQLSSIHSEAEYNWINTELIHWKQPDGSKNEALIYKPENFDPRKKYPSIMNLYENQTNALYNFISPSLSDGSLDIPFFVSNGYIVICPNIIFKDGNAGRSAFNSIISLSEYLNKYSWIDRQKMGIHGISFGGYEVNYIITKTKLFAAAAESAGPIDLISGYGSINGFGESYQRVYEMGQARIGATLWKRPDQFIDGSPVFFLHKVETPLLMMHNEEDKQVPWQQGIELFTGLRRLQKPVWLLQYVGESHGLGQFKKNQIDYTIRLKQFFDFYLKGASKPDWMGQP